MKYGGISITLKTSTTWVGLDGCLALLYEDDGVPDGILNGRGRWRVVSGQGVLAGSPGHHLQTLGAASALDASLYPDHALVVVCVAVGRTDR